MSNTETTTMNPNQDWQVEMLRAEYIRHGGLASDPIEFSAWLEYAIETATERGVSLAPLSELAAELVRIVNDQAADATVAS